MARVCGGDVNDEHLHPLGRVSGRPVIDKKSSGMAVVA
jgi:hypothetical protein